MENSITKISDGNFQTIYELYIKYRNSAGIQSSLSEISKYLASELKKYGDEFFVKQINGTAVGFMQFITEQSTLSGTRYRIKAMYIDDKYQGNGFAKQLIQALKNHTEKSDIIVKTKRTNKISPSLYLSNGFIEDDEFIHFVYHPNQK